MTAMTVFDSLQRLREQAPLVHNITNYVVMNNTANALLAVGASPAMVHSEEEVEEFVSISSALVINIGTLSPAWVAAMKLAADRAAALGKPWVVDPVGAGATGYRTRTANDLLQRKPTVLRGNASEVLAVAGAAAATKGVDSGDKAEDAVDLAKRMATARGTVVAITGATDYVTDGVRVRAVRNGHPLMAKVTGLGCTATALIGAFLAGGQHPVDATAHALAVFGLAGELAAEKATGPGTLQLHLYDALHNLDRATVERRVRLD